MVLSSDAQFNSNQLKSFICGSLFGFISLIVFLIKGLPYLIQNNSWLSLTVILIIIIGIREIIKPYANSYIQSIKFNNNNEINTPSQDDIEWFLNYMETTPPHQNILTQNAHPPPSYNTISSAL